MVVFILVLLGLCIGSFINAFVGRLHAGKNWVTDRSACDHCGHTLAPKDLIPLVSWLSLRGKCRYCKKPVSVQNPISELLTAGLFVGSYLFWPHGLEGEGALLFGFWLVLLSGFMALVLYDLSWMELPNSIVFTLIGVVTVQWLAVLVFYDGGVGLARDVLLGGLVGGGLFYVLFQVSSGRWIGGGDVKLGFLLGLLLASPIKSFLMIFVASLLGTLFSLPLMAAKKLNKDSKVPFGPFLILAGIIVYLWGGELIGWYQAVLLP